MAGFCLRSVIRIHIPGAGKMALIAPISLIAAKVVAVCAHSRPIARLHAVHVARLEALLDPEQTVQCDMAGETQRQPVVLL